MASTSDERELATGEREPSEQSEGVPSDVAPSQTPAAVPGNRLGVLFALHLLLMLFSFGGILSKLASGYPFMSLGFILCYGGMVAVLGIYAIGWQQVIKRIPLTTAYANRAVTVIWGIVWGALLFHESVNAFKVVGALVVLAGVVLFALADNQPKGDDAA